MEHFIRFEELQNCLTIVKYDRITTMKWCYECENYTRTFWVVSRNSEKVYCKTCGTLLTNHIERKVRKMSRHSINSFLLFFIIFIFAIAAIYGGH